MKTIILTVVCGLIFCAASAFGKDRALLVGIDHYKTVSDTPGGVADAVAIADFIQKKYRFSKDSIHILKETEATAAKIKNEIQTWLIDGTKPGDRIFFFYSGHGGQVDDDNGDELDELDEVLAPYDVYPGSDQDQTSNFIRDDEINLFLLKMAGRRVVMAFDSCHSGTLSRVIEPKSKFVTLKNKFTPFNTVRNFGDAQSYLPKNKAQRDLSVINEDIIDDKLNGVVIFSATAPNQSAMWLKDESRGAFAYAFQKVQEDSDRFLTVGEIDERIKKYIDYLKKEKLVISSQVSETEIVSKYPLRDKPLFSEDPSRIGSSADWEAPIFSSLQNPLAEFNVKIDLNGKSFFHLGEAVEFSVYVSGLKTNEKGYLYIFDFALDETGEKYVNSLFPTAIGSDSENEIFNGTQQFPRKIANKDNAITAQTKGKDVFVALVTKKKLKFKCDADDKCGSWDEVYAQIGINDLQKQIEKKVAEITRSFGNRPKLEGGDWQAASVVVAVR